MAKNILNEVALPFNSFMRRMNAIDPKKEQRILQELKGDVFSTDDPEWAKELRRQQGEENAYTNEHYPWENDWEDLPEDGSDNEMANIIGQRANGESSELELSSKYPSYTDIYDEEGEHTDDDMEYNHDLGETPEGDENEWLDSDDEGVDGDDDYYLEEAQNHFVSLMERMDYVQKNGSISLNEVSLGMYQRAIDNASSKSYWGYKYGLQHDEDGQYIDNHGRRYKDKVKAARANFNKLRETDPIYQQAREIFDPDDVEWDGFEREYGETYGGCTGVVEYDDGWRFEVYAYMDSPEADPEIEEVYFYAPDGQHGYLN